MKLLIDTDVLLDFALDRPPFAENAARLLDHLQEQPGTAYLAWHSLSNFYYLCSSGRDKKTAKKFIHDLLQFIQVAPTVTQDARKALEIKMNDFEDALQAAAAMACGAQRIVTRNLKHYKKSPILAISPQEFLGLR